MVAKAMPNLRTRTKDRLQIADRDGSGLSLDMKEAIDRSTAELKAAWGHNSPVDGSSSRGIRLKSYAPRNRERQD